MTTDRQVDAALEGARDMVEANRNAVDPTRNDPVDQRGGGGSIAGTGTSQGGSNSTVGIDDAADPSAETGGPRGAGTSVSKTSGGRIEAEGDPRGVEPDEFVKRETAVFEPGTGRKPE